MENEEDEAMINLKEKGKKLGGFERRRKMITTWRERKTSFYSL